MTRTLLALSLLLCGTTAAAADSSVADSSAVTPNAEQEAVYKALSMRHDTLSCDQLDAMSSDPLGTYLFLIEHAEQPAWVGMRAASCVLENHAQAAQPELQRWVSSSDTRGLAILAMDRLDSLPLEIAQDLATRALTDGPDPEGMRKRIAKSTVPELAALANLPLTQPAGQ
ncbi:MAG: hypothetical protein GXP62_17865 [Oligoflexia bacterium]|nr:hypothetical protein [Oligoflexia bacterium]